jgi:hypothetical protein
MSGEKVVPNSLNYAKVKPEAVDAYSRRVKSIATNAQNFGENQYVNIILDTAVPGANIDPLQSYLKFDLTIINPNPFIDYVSFGTCGAASVIDEFRVICQGTPIEEILNYSTVHELFADLCGFCKEPYYMYRPCKISQKVDEKFEINAIKPPMVSRTGDPMYYQAVFGTNRNLSSVWTQSSNSSGGNTNKPYLLSTSASGVSFHKFIQTQGSIGVAGLTNKLTYVNSTASSKLRPPYISAISLSKANVYPNSSNLTDDLTLTTIQNTVPFELPSLMLGRTKQADTNSWGAYWSNSSDTLSQASVITNNQTLDHPNYTNCINSNTGTACFQPGVTYDYIDGNNSAISGMPPATSLFGSTSYFFRSNTNTGSVFTVDTDPLNPFNWPFVMENDRYKNDEDDKPILNEQDYFMSLCNVKLLPIGIKGQVRGSATSSGSGTITDYIGTSNSSSNFQSSLNFTNVDQLTTFSKSTTVTVEIALVSGIFGSMASKMFPTMLGAPGSTMIQFKTAPASKAFQVSMDPCRIVLGTIRDYIKFGGSLGGVFGQFSYLNPTGDSTDTDATSGKSISAFTNSLLSNLNYYPKAGTTGTGTAQNITYTPTVSNSYFGVASGAIIPGYLTQNGTNAAAFQVTDRYLLGSCFACIGANLLPFQTYLQKGGNGSNAADSFALCFSPYSTCAMEGKWTTYDKFDEKQAVSYIDTVKTYQLKSAYTSAISGTSNTNTGSAMANGQGFATSLYQTTYGSMNSTGYSGTAFTAGNATGYLYVDNATSTSTGTPNTLQACNSTIGAAASNQMISAYSQSALEGYNVGNPATLVVQTASACAAGNNQVIGVDSFINQSIDTNNAINPIDDGNASATVLSNKLGGQILSIFRPTVAFATPSGRMVLSDTNPGTLFSSGTGNNGPQLTFQQADTTYAPTDTNWVRPGPLENIQEVTVCGHPSGIPLPQYILGYTPWAKKSLFVGLAAKSGSNIYSIYGDTVSPSDLCSETIACYGSYLPHSVAQSLRCFNQYGGNTNYVTYQIQNVEFVSQQVILPQNVAADILDIASQGEGISISSNSVRVYQSPVNSSTTQNIIIPATIASANAMYVYFIPQNHSSTTEGQLYNSNSRMCPFSKIWTQDPYPQTSCTQASSVSSLANYSVGQYAVGQSTPFGVRNAPSKSGSFQIQLVLGNEYIPVQPMTCISEIVAELVKCQHKLFDTQANSSFGFSLTERYGYLPTTSQTLSSTTDYGNTSDVTQYFYNALAKRDFCSAFTFPAYLDDQTYVQNPNWNYVGAAMWNSAVTGYGTSIGQLGISGATNSLYGARGPYTLPLFTPAESTFVIGFDLDNWSGYSDVARSGNFLGNQTITLRITDAIALDYQSQKTGIIGINMYAAVVHDIRLSFQAGGTIVEFY